MIKLVGLNVPFPEFKLEAIGQVVKYQGVDVREVALALEPNPDHLRTWIHGCKAGTLVGTEPAGNAITLNNNAKFSSLKRR